MRIESQLCHVYRLFCKPLAFKYFRNLFCQRYLFKVSQHKKVELLVTAGIWRWSKGGTPSSALNSLSTLHKSAEKPKGPQWV